ncbi:MAG TPA: hypothetical protein VK468_07585 [Pyrinomonadaceae bacterium]|nr:hypothetical protein [Pyrinomonadaceae bacterium]
MNAPQESAPPKGSVRILLSEIIDYAGLFPPSQVSMQEAVLNFATYKNSNYGWMLGRLILPVSRLDEFLECAGDLIGRETETPWRLSVLAGEDIYDTIKLINAFNSQHAASVVCDVLEVKANTVSKIENTVKSLPDGLTAYFEIATGENFADLAASLALHGQRAKIRTGGVRREDFPPSSEIIRFVRTCQAANVPFKATAGLHHPLRCFRPLTYASDAPQGTMHGFLNMLMMTGFARESFRPSLLEQIMEEEFEEVFTVRENGIAWRNEHFLSNSHIERMRSNGLNSFGSCSFEEPIADLQGIGLL